MKKVIAFIILPLMLLSGCSPFDPDSRTDKPYNRVMILFSLGRNSLDSWLDADISDLCNPALGTEFPGEKDKRALVIVSHGYEKSTELTNPYIIRIYMNKKNEVVRDTLLRMDKNKILTTPADMREALDFVRKEFESEHYGMVYSSHGTGWLPKQYYDKPRIARWSLGEEKMESQSYEMGIDEIAQGIPMHLDYLLFDACLMGNIETIYQLRGIADCIAASPTEILTDGFDYTKITRDLLLNYPSSPEDVCSHYYNQYEKRSGDSQSATITLVDCSGLEGLATLCKELVQKYRTQIDGIESKSVQRYFRPSSNSAHNWFFDLEDIFRKAGASAEDLDRLEKALDKCITYKAATPAFMPNSGGFEITSFSGLGMMIPRCGDEELLDHYRKLDWNKATGLVQ